MRITRIDTKLLIEKLEIVGNAINVKNPNITLVGTKIVANEDKIIFVGTDGESSIKTTILKDEVIGEIKETGTVLVEYKSFYTLLSKLRCKTVELYTQNDKQLIVQNEDNIYKFNLINAEQYPNIEFKKLDNEFEIKIEQLKNMVSKVAFCCATKENKPILTGVNISSANNEVLCIATDSYRLAKYTMNYECKPFNITISKKSIQAISKIANKTKQESVKFLYNDTNSELLINIDNTLYKTRLLEGKYPETSRILLTTNCNDYVVDRELLLEAIDRISTFGISNSEEIANLVVVLTFENDTLEISCENQAKGQASEKIKILENENHTKREIGCSSAFLIDALKTFDTQTIRLQNMSSERPIYINGISSDITDYTNVQVVLPIRLRKE